jgi:hypothetical protein
MRRESASGYGLVCLHKPGYPRFIIFWWDHGQIYFPTETRLYIPIETRFMCTILQLSQFAQYIHFHPFQSDQDANATVIDWRQSNDKLTLSQAVQASRSDYICSKEDVGMIIRAFQKLPSDEIFRIQEVLQESAKHTSNHIILSGPARRKIEAKIVYRAFLERTAPELTIEVTPVTSLSVQRANKTATSYISYSFVFNVLEERLL